MIQHWHYHSSNQQHRTCLSFSSPASDSLQQVARQSAHSLMHREQGYQQQLSCKWQPLPLFLPLLQVATAVMLAAWRPWAAILQTEAMAAVMCYC
jgi:hypothetical protein